MPIKKGSAIINLTTNRKRSRMEEELDHLFLFVSVEHISTIKLAGMVLFGLLAFMITFNFKQPAPYIAAALCTALGYFLPEIIVARLKKRRQQQFSEQVVDALVLLSNGLRAGFTMQQALEMLEQEAPKPMSQEIQLVLRENRLGVDLNTCLLNCVKRTGDEDFELAITAVHIARQLGGNLAEIFDRIVTMVRDRKILKGKVGALTSQGKMQAAVVGLLPYAFGYALTKINPEMMELMWTTLPGFLALVLIIILDVLGYLWVLKIANVEY
jgi:tight adherence protein B